MLDDVPRRAEWGLFVDVFDVAGRESELGGPILIERETPRSM
jgi:hypothetical protein